MANRDPIKRREGEGSIAVAAGFTESQIIVQDTESVASTVRGVGGTGGGSWGLGHWRGETGNRTS